MEQGPSLKSALSKEAKERSVPSSKTKERTDPAPAINNFPGADPTAPSLAEFLDYLTELAFVEWRPRRTSQYLTFEKMIAAVYFTGTLTKRSRNSARWLCDVLQFPAALRHEWTRARIPQMHKPREEWGGRQILFDEVTATVFERAAELARETAQIKVYALRHVIMAMLERDAATWNEAGTAFDEQMLARAQQHIVDGMAESPVAGEDMAAWQQLLPAREDRLSAQRDGPAFVDQLEREPFAQVIARRLVEVREAQRAAAGEDDRAYVVHLDGPWGSGKSSVLNFVMRELRQRKDPWLIVRFNAWREQNIRPPWWAIMSQVARQLIEQTSGIRTVKLRAIWYWWQFRRQWLAVVGTIVLIVLTIWLFPRNKMLSEWTFSDISGLLAGGATIFALIRNVSLGSSKKTQAIDELGENPYGSVLKIFARLIRVAEAPVLVLIDDIDRCEGANVVALLENIQTTLRHAPVSYLVAGDRKWIVASFEKAYADFCTPIGEEARPVGHLFLEKLFQLSVSVPRLSPEVQSRYWNGLLGQGEAAPSGDLTGMAEQAVANIETQEGLQQAIDRRGTDQATRDALRRAAALKVASQANARALEHRFAHLAQFVEHNPRAMKRLINALGMRQAVLFLEGRKIEPEVLARWTILELRWPTLADQLVQNREWLDEPATAPSNWAALLVSPSVQAILGQASQQHVTSASLDTLFGKSDLRLPSA